EEAAAIGAEFDAQPLFRDRDLHLAPDLARRVTGLAAELRSDEQIGNVLVNRLSTRALIHWAGLSAITGGPLADVASQALFTTLPREARDRAVELVHRVLGDAAVGGGDRLAGLKTGWPDVRHGQAVPVDQVEPPTHARALAPRPVSSDVVVHQVRYQKRLADGTRVLIGEPFHRHDRGRVGLG